MKNFITLHVINEHEFQLGQLEGKPFLFNVSEISLIEPRDYTLVTLKDPEPVNGTVSIVHVRALRFTVRETSAEIKALIEGNCVKTGMPL